jgi:hypothetical protein
MIFAIVFLSITVLINIILATYLFKKPNFSEDLSIIPKPSSSNTCTAYILSYNDITRKNNLSNIAIDLSSQSNIGNHNERFKDDFYKGVIQFCLIKNIAYEIKAIENNKVTLLKSKYILSKRTPTLRDFNDRKDCIMIIGFNA